MPETSVHSTGAVSSHTGRSGAASMLRGSGQDSDIPLSANALRQAKRPPICAADRVTIALRESQILLLTAPGAHWERAGKESGATPIFLDCPVFSSTSAYAKRARRFGGREKVCASPGRSPWMHGLPCIGCRREGR